MNQSTPTPEQTPEHTPKPTPEPNQSTPESTPSTDAPSLIPSAEIVADRSPLRFLAWLIPIIVSVIVVMLINQYTQQAGVNIKITFADGHGIRQGDVVRCKGIIVGQVEKVALSNDVESVITTVRLNHESAHLARQGTRFWIARPQVSIEGISGLETITGPRYIALLPTVESQKSQYNFEGLDTPPVLATEPPGGLEITLHASRRRSLRAGAPVLYRQTRIGTVTRVSLASDATSVEAQAYIRPGYTTIIRENTRFWNASGADFNASFQQGFSFQVESVQTLLAGGVGVATPDQFGPPVSTGHRFQLAQRATDEWLEWQPNIPLGSAWLPEGLAPPNPQYATVIHKRKGIFTRDQKLSGWLLPVDGGLLGPTNLLKNNPEQDGPISILEMAGQQILLNQDTQPRGKEIAFFPLQMEKTKPWPTDRIRKPNNPAEPEDNLIFNGRSLSPRAIAAVHLQYNQEQNAWTIDPSITFDESMHGASVIARSDGKLIGILIVKDALGHIALVN